MPFLFSKSLKLFVCFSVLGLCSSCLTRGNDFSSHTDWIRVNQSKQTDFAKYLGEPLQVGNASGVATWTYGFYKFKVFGESYTKELKLWWNSDRTVKYFSFNSSFPADKSKLLQAVPAGGAGIPAEEGL